MSTAIVTHKDCILHDTGIHHPESQERLLSVFKTLKNFKSKKIQWIDGPNINLKHINLVHSEHHIKNIINNVPTKGFFNIDADTVLSPNSIKSAFKAMGSVCKAVDLICTEKFKNAFCPIRPPGHHAEPEKAMGFCLFNNVAIGAYYAKLKYKLKKCAVIDFDVHHGNGTQKKFWNDPNMFYASTHQEGIFPGTGFKNEIGVNNNIINVPLPGGTNGLLFKKSYEDIIIPNLKKFSPDMIFISAGFDGHKDDPLADFKLTEEDFFWVTNKLRNFSDKYCKKRLVSCLEGGYNIDALSKSSLAHVKGLIL